MRVREMALWEDRSAPHSSAVSWEPRNHAETAGCVRCVGPNDPPAAPEPEFDGVEERPRARRRGPTRPRSRTRRPRAPRPVPEGPPRAEAARRAGTRALLYPAAGFTDWDRDYGEHVHLVRFAPHDWLLPRTAAAVHHGGAGTTHGALAAGVPQGVIPFSLDQPYFARRVAALGLGPGGFDPGRTDVEGLTRILTDLTRGERAEGYRRRAREAVRVVERENGARTAARILLGS